MSKLPSLQRPHKEADATRSSQLSFELTPQQPPSDLISPPVIRSTVFDAAHSDPPLDTKGNVIKQKGTGGRRFSSVTVSKQSRLRLSADEAAEEIANRVK